ncbi:hypothetical protein [Deinococcus multiflagellatus]|uniref:hypothetical protein n=1 Tax=Deinococcus multiflagellatus TaxID=1656887 RepID=UPI001CCD7DCD|nr:hypothetical protein [Deinococcus multiflagellatus]MBZ9712797.1 hypothetical protein [Deinococcus multiflagellatus]
MSAVTYHDTRTETREDYGREHQARPAPAIQAHPSWREHDHFELWVEWQQRDSAGRWHPHQAVTHRTFRTREDTLLHAERLIGRGDFPMEGGSPAPVTLLRNRRAALLSAFREAEGDGVTLIREVRFPVGEYALSLRVTCERLASPVRATFSSAANPLRSLAGQRVKLTVLIEHPYDVLVRAEGPLDLGERAARVGTEAQTFAPGASVTGVPYRSATVTVPRGLLKKPLLYRYELAAEAAEREGAPSRP